MSLEVKIKKKLKEFTLESELNVETGCTGLMDLLEVEKALL